MSVRRNPAFLSQADDRSRLPVALLSGFLGSGKTTLVNALLNDPRMANTAVAVNEFGDIPIDRDLIDHGADRTVALANGCLCCNISGDMEGAVMRLFSRREAGALPQFERLLIEPSGLSDPAPIMQTILRNPIMSRAFRLEAIVTTVDALFIESQLARHAETRKQIALADHLVLTKFDLVDADAIRTVRGSLQNLHPDAPIHSAAHGAIDPAAIFPPAFFDPDAPSQKRSGLIAERIEPSPHLGDITAVSLSAESPLDWHSFDSWLRDLRLRHAEDLLRVKAVLNLSGVNGPVIVHGVHHVMHQPVKLDTWPDEARSSRLVLIVHSPLAERVRASWAREFNKSG